MCGIYGYVGKSSNAAKIIFEGLKNLEYRGYDSWGIAVKDRQSLLVEKHVGKINQNEPALPKSNLGIGHTRWATHGGVTKYNAHPHLDCTKTIAVVHNGIIENYEDIKGKLLKKDHKFSSETDTEVISHLIEENLKTEGFASSVRDAFNQLKGLNAIVVAYSTSQEIAAAKSGSPLVIGISEEGIFVASDIIGILKHTSNVLFLKDNQMAIIGRVLQILKLPEGKKVRQVIHKIKWNFKEAEKGKFKHFMLKEIYEQPQILENIALNCHEQAKKLADLIKGAFGTFFLGCGTASYAALSGTYLFSRIAKKHINFSIGSEFKYIEDYLTPKSLVVAISQSGETIDIVDPVEKAKKRGSKIAAIVNTIGSTLYRQANFHLLLGAGPEKAVVGTKSFIAMVATIILTAYAFVNKTEEGKRLLLKASGNVKEILKVSYIKKIKNLAKELKKKNHIFVIGRGFSYATALEAALKLKETSLIHSEGFAGGELKHGVIALVEKETPCIVIAPNDETYVDIISNAQELKTRGGLIIGIGPQENKVFDRWLSTEDIGDATIIPQTVIVQLLAYHLALERGIKDIDKPRNLAKSVTVK